MSMFDHLQGQLVITVLMDDNAHPHRARVVNDYLEDEGIERLD